MSAASWALIETFPHRTCLEAVLPTELDLEVALLASRTEGEELALREEAAAIGAYVHVLTPKIDPDRYLGLREWRA